VQVTDQTNRTMLAPGTPTGVDPDSLFLPLPPGSDGAAQAEAVAAGIDVSAIRFITRARQIYGGRRYSTAGQPVQVAIRPRGDYVLAMKTRDGEAVGW